MALLAVRNLSVQFQSGDGTTQAVDDISFHIRPAETLGLVGESGCGKSVTALALMRLIAGNGRVTGGEVFLEGRDLLTLDEPDMRALRGNRLAMIFQEPMTSLNPALTIGHQIAEAVRIHEAASAQTARTRALDMLQRVRMPDAARRLDDYPHQLSGGQRQRVMIAMALICKPALLIADEPTTALDVTIQAQILDLIRTLKAETGTSVLLITHDLGVVAEMCTEVAVMYAGRIVEQAPVMDLFERPAHPYTRGLMLASARGTRGGLRLQRLHEIAGQVAQLTEPAQGCGFAPRCTLATEVCRIVRPELRAVGEAQRAACHHLDRVTA